MINDFFNPQIKHEDCLPNVICTECQKELNNYYEFKKKCVLTYQKLKSHVLAVKQLGTNHKTDVKSTTGDTTNNGDTVVDVIGNNTLNDSSVLSSVIAVEVCRLLLPLIYFFTHINICT